MATDTSSTGPQRVADAPAPARTTTRLLHIEDSEADALLFQEHIRAVVPAVEFDTVTRMEDLTADSIISDCAILDLSLPGSRGLEALHALRALSDDLPIIVLTGMDDLDLAVEALRDGADDYLVKNEVGGALLRRGIRYAIERRRLRRELVTEATATAIATAQTFMAEDALRIAQADTIMAKAALSVAYAGMKTAEEALQQQVGSSLQAPSAPGDLSIDLPDVATTTHEVTVGVDDVTGEYALRCTDCEWVAARGSESQHTWHERNLDAALLEHVDFGGLLASDAAMPRGLVRAVAAAGETVFGPALAARGLREPSAPTAAQIGVDPDGLEPPTSAL